MWVCRDGFRRSSFGMFPIVRYTGYAVLVPNTTTQVLSEEMKSGMIVTPGNFFSSSFYTGSD
jgi:hypothetical protein